MNEATRYLCTGQRAILSQMVMTEPGWRHLYTNCILALNPKTGELKWHYQFTPHDVSDREATEPPLLVDATITAGSEVYCCIGSEWFFYVLGRTSGELLLAKSSCTEWIGPTGIARTTARSDRPKGCPDDARELELAAFSPGYPACSTSWRWKSARGARKVNPDQTGTKVSAALNIRTGTSLEVPQPGPAKAKTWSGVLATAGGLVFYGSRTADSRLWIERMGSCFVAI